MSFLFLFSSISIANEGSPDSYGYVWTDSNSPAPTVSYSWDEILGTGTPLFSGCDDCGVSIPIGFTFNYYGVGYTNTYVSSNGFLNLGSSSDQFWNEPLPSSSPTGKVAPFWSDLYAADVVSSQTFGSAPNRYLVVQWNVAHLGDTSSPLIFQAVLRESGEIEFRYNTMTGSYADGSFSTIGLEKTDGSIVNQYSYNTSTVSDGMVIEFAVPGAGGGGGGGGTYSPVDTPKALPDTSTTTSTITIADTGTITDINVGLDITHTWDGDLGITLIAPDGTRVLLVNRRGGGSDDFTNTVLDDEASTPIMSGTPPFTGSYIPDESLATFYGMSLTGDWTLEIVDNAGGDIGTLNDWSLDITTSGGGGGGGGGGSYTSADTPIVHPGGTTITSDIVITDTGTLSDLNVELDISNTWDGDLVITLIAPDGTNVLLVNQRGGGGWDFANTILDDQASTVIGSGTAPFTGSFFPYLMVCLLQVHGPFK